MKKRFYTFLLIWCILVILFNIVAWIIPATRTEEFYISYAIITAAMIIQLLIVFVAFRKEYITTANIVMGAISSIILIIISNLYLVYHNYLAPFFVAVFPNIYSLELLLDHSNIPVIIIILDSILLAINYIMSILLGQHSNTIKERDQRVKDKTDYTRRIAARLKTVADERNDTRLEKAYEELIYSKNITSENGVNLLNRITEILDDILRLDKNTVIDSECEELFGIIRKINNRDY